LALVIKKSIVFSLLFLLAASLSSASPIAPPPAGQLYHGVFPGGFNQNEDVIDQADLISYQQTVGKKAAWVYFSNNWFRNRAFPSAEAGWIRDNGSIPFIRLMLRSSEELNTAEAVFTLDRINNGDFDNDLKAWARSAKEFKTPIMAEYGTEVNGSWFSWNGAWNGGTGTGPKKFQEAYRRIIRIAREEGAANLLWVFHVNDRDDPPEYWNRLENYYPGDDWIDWLGVSVYGAQKPSGETNVRFRKLMDKVYPRLVKLAPDKPIALLEFGITSLNKQIDQADWADRALKDLTGRRWPRVIGFAWWNEAWHNGSDPRNDTNMRVQDNPALAKVFKKRVGANDKVLGKIVLIDPDPGTSNILPLYKKR
jgi:hypothetical protein